MRIFVCFKTDPVPGHKLLNTRARKIQQSAGILRQRCTRACARGGTAIVQQQSTTLTINSAKSQWPRKTLPSIHYTTVELAFVSYRITRGLTFTLGWTCVHALNTCKRLQQSDWTFKPMSSELTLTNRRACCTRSRARRDRELFQQQSTTLAINSAKCQQLQRALPSQYIMLCILSHHIDTTQCVDIDDLKNMLHLCGRKEIHYT